MSSSEGSDGYHSAEDDLTPSSAPTTSNFSSDTRSIETYGGIARRLQHVEQETLTPLDQAGPSRRDDPVGNSVSMIEDLGLADGDQDQVDDGWNSNNEDHNHDKDSDLDCIIAQKSDSIHSELLPNNLEGWDLDDEELSDNEKGLDEILRIIGAHALPNNVTIDNTRRDSNEISTKDHERVNMEEYNKMRDEDAISSWSSWGKNWGVASILSTASESVCSITQGLSNAIETGLGVPQPIKLLKDNLTNESKTSSSSEDECVKRDQKQEDGMKKVSVIEGIFGGVSNIGSKVINTGLDTLETLGKKTMEVLQEGDPGLKKKRLLFSNIESPKLSQLLREAQEVNVLPGNINAATRSSHFDKLLDDYNGLIHYEALEMIADQSCLKIKNYLDECNDEIRDDLDDTFKKIKEMFELNYCDEDDKADSSEFSRVVLEVLRNLDVTVTTERLTELSNHIEEEKLNGYEESEIYTACVSTLAMFVALSMELFHRLGECLIVKHHRQPEMEADDLFDLYKVIIMRINWIGCHYSEQLLSMNEQSTHITNTFYEVSNTVSYISKGYQSFLPILQVGAIKT